MTKLQFANPEKAGATSAAVRAALESEKLNFEFLQDGATAIMKFIGEKYTYDVLVFCSDEFVTVQCRYPLSISNAARSSMLELINSINIENPVGSFELISKGTALSVKVGISVKSFTPSVELIVEAIYRAFRLAEANFAAIENLLK